MGSEDTTRQVKKRTIQFAILFCLVVMAPFLFFGGPNPTSSETFQAAWNLGHILFFALLTIWARRVWGFLQGDLVQ